MRQAVGATAAKPRSTRGIARLETVKLNIRGERAYPGEAPDGPYFAEVYLTWYFGKGSVMYRSRFDSSEAAAAAAKLHAKFLDDELPHTYLTEDWSGKPYREKHEYGIEYLSGECSSRPDSALLRVYSTTLPGSSLD